MRFVAVVWIGDGRTASPTVLARPGIAASRDQPAQTIASAELVRILYVTAMARPPK